jgi:tRNA-uridine 2-sulfurtransferase
VRIAVRLEQGRVADAGFDAEGCGALTAAASAVVEYVRGEPVMRVALLTPQEISVALGELSPAKLHAADLATDALHRSLALAAKDGAISLPAAPRRTLVAMSGGVDSAVAAQMALDRGDDVVAVTVELWADPATDGSASCCSPQAVVGARALAHRMGIPHLTLDLRDEFRAGVVDPFLDGYAGGSTPNPCVRCNGFVRFDAMLALAERLGAARLATGHYARIQDDGCGALLASAADPAKDQAYMLARLRPEGLARLWFPLGGLRKTEVRERARRAGLPVADRRESQDLCFLAGLGKRGFIRRHGSSERGGEIVDGRGRVLGHHDGQSRFTVGQRRGIGIAAPEPLYVIGKDALRRRVTVGPRSALATRIVEVRDARLHRDGAAVDRVRLRYRSRPLRCRIEGEPGAGEHARLRLVLAEAAEGVAPGQAACLMRGERVLGVATIAPPGARADEVAAGQEAPYGA